MICTGKTLSKWTATKTTVPIKNHSLIGLCNIVMDYQQTMKKEEELGEETQGAQGEVTLAQIMWLSGEGTISIWFQGFLGSSKHSRHETFPHHPPKIINLVSIRNQTEGLKPSERRGDAQV